MIMRLIFPILVLLLAGCSSTPVAVVSKCQSADWYEIGRQDGAQGEPAERLEARRQECRNYYTEKAEAVYLNGRERGLVEYCTPENGLALGRRGELYYYVCPYNLEGGFTSAFKRGKRILALERANQDLDRKISELSAGQANRAPASVENTELEMLKKQRDLNEREKNKLESVIVRSEI